MTLAVVCVGAVIAAGVFCFGERRLRRASDFAAATYRKMWLQADDELHRLADGNPGGTDIRRCPDCAAIHRLPPIVGAPPEGPGKGGGT